MIKSRRVIEKIRKKLRNSIFFSEIFLLLRLRFSQGGGRNLHFKLIIDLLIYTY